jgi:nucleoside-diphosphate-sugar epimerase
MRVLLTGGSGVLGRVATPRLRAAGHQVDAPPHNQLDLFDVDQVKAAVRQADAVLHLATRIPPPDDQGNPEAWQENDRLRREATGILVDAALAAGVQRFIFPSIAFVYPSSGLVDESTPVAEDLPWPRRSALDAEAHVARFAEGGGQGVVLRLGWLYGPGTGSEAPASRYVSFGATLQVEDAGRALVAALDAPSRTYNVVGDAGRVSNARFKQVTGWRAQH